MEKAFRDYLRKGFTRFMKEAAPEFRESTKEAGFQGDVAGSLAFRWNGQAPTIWLALEFVRDRSYVLLRLYWTQPGEPLDPSRLLKCTLERRQAVRAEGREPMVEDYLDLPLGSLDSADFEFQRDTFQMTQKCPPRERIRPIMSTPEAQKTLAIIDLAGDKWEGSPGTDEWYSIIAYGNDKLTAHDAEIAVGGTLANVQSFASTHYLAYAKRLRTHRPGRSDS